MSQRRNPETVDELPSNQASRRPDNKSPAAAELRILKAWLFWKADAALAEGTQKNFAEEAGISEAQVTNKIKRRLWNRVDERTWLRLVDYFKSTVRECLESSEAWSRTKEGRAWIKGPSAAGFSENAAAALAKLQQLGELISPQALELARRVDNGGGLRNKPGDSEDEWIRRFRNYQEAQVANRKKPLPKVPADLVPTRPIHRTRARDE